jgi:phosphoribosylamine--glycine ligase
VIEERLEGQEASFYAICDGERFAVFSHAQDHKRALDGDLGENTGGMGAYSPAGPIDAALEREIVETIVRPTVAGMRAEGRPFRGALFVGLMIDAGRPRVIEFNARFGDPETQALLFRLESDLVPLLVGAAEGRLPDDPAPVRFGDPAVCVVLASEGYPRGYPTGREIRGLDALTGLPDAKVFHSGTRRVAGHWLTAGGRVLGVTARGATLEAARSRAYELAAQVRFDGAHYRRDIAAGAPRSPRS